MMPALPRRLMSPMLATIAACLASAAVLAVALPSSDGALRVSFEAALDKPVIMAANTGQKDNPPFAASEDYWLSAVRADAAKPFVQSVNTGDRITILSGGTSRVLEVAEVSDVSKSATYVDTAAPNIRLALVTARDINSPKAGKIRFLLEIGQEPATVVSAQPARTL